MGGRRRRSLGLWLAAALIGGTATVLAVAVPAPAADPESERIAYSVSLDLGPEDPDDPGSLRVRNRDVYTAGADGTERRRLTDAPGADDSPDVSPDGSLIAFASQRNGAASIWTMNADGTGQREISPIPGRDPAFSPDGTRIAFSGKAVPDQDGRDETAIYVMNADPSTNLGPDLRRLTDAAEGVLDFQPAWSPDGSTIAFASTRDAARVEIYGVASDGTGTPQKLTTDTTGTYTRFDNPEYSPDGTRILLTCRSTGFDVCAMGADGQGITPLTETHDDAGATFSPDGTSIMFVSDRGPGPPVLFTMDPAGVTETPVPTQTAPEESGPGHPSWGPAPLPPDASAELPAEGGTVATNETVTPDDIVGTSVTAPAGGAVSIAERPRNPGDVTPEGFSMVAQQVRIEAPAATAAVPLRIGFRLDSSVRRPGLPLTVFRDGVAVAPCTDPAGTSAEPDPCAEPPAELGDGDVLLSVRTSHGGAWAFGVDDTGPTVTCEGPDGQWHAGDVVRHCTATDPSGLAEDADAGFDLTTAVPDGTETPDALTGTHEVCDGVGNCRTVGPLGDNLVDRKAPEVVLTAPADDSRFGLFSSPRAGYSCADGGSGVLVCGGTRPPDAKLPAGPLDIGPHTFTVTATDRAGNLRAVTHRYRVGLLPIG